MFRPCIGLFILTITFGPSSKAAPTTIAPSADGTLVDGGGFGLFDGAADSWDWTFNESSFEGSIALSTHPATVPVEYRVVSEFSLATVDAALPITAVFRFMLRGAPRFPASDAIVHVYAFPADLLERPDDYYIGPPGLVGVMRVPAFQPLSQFALNASRAVNDALAKGRRSVGFRFQIDPDTDELISQAFLDALDSNVTSKPSLSIEASVPGDSDDDQDVDLLDYDAFLPCFRGPDVENSPMCLIFDFDWDHDTDLTDYEAFQHYRSFFHN